MIMASACSKIILFGEHAVVYGEPSIAVPIIELRAQVSIVPNDQHLIFVGHNLDTPVGYTTAPDHPFSILVRTFIEKYSLTIPKITITISSDIPIASGLGSGAAISTAIVRGLEQYYALDIPLKEQNELVYQIENIFHGSSSGVDNTVIVYEQSIYFVRGQLPQLLQNVHPFHVLIANTGVQSETHIAVNDIKRLHEKNANVREIVKEIGQITMKAQALMNQGNWRDLGELMLQNHRLLSLLTVSSPELDMLVTTAMQAGALGAKLSGGGRGGHMLALVEEDKIQPVTQALLNTGAKRVTPTIISASRSS